MTASNRTLTPTKPFLRWAGSKKQLLPIISKYWTSKHQRYIEPFAGSASLFFYLQPRNAILGDINTELIFTYEQVKNNLSNVVSELGKFKKGKEEYYHLRTVDPNILDPAKRAARFIYLNRFCYNGLYRTNRKGQFNVPYGGEKVVNVTNYEILLACSKALQGAILVSGDFEKVLRDAKESDFVYLDPPYRVKSQRVFNEYDASTFSLNDLKRLRIWLDKLTERGIDFLMSYADCDEAELLKKGHLVQFVSVKRNIAGFANKRRKATEVIISNKSLPINKIILKS